jgi:GTP cyclohydrolase I
MENMSVTPISEVITNRIRKSGARFHGNDNISDFIKEGELKALIEEATGKMEAVLKSLLIDTENDWNTKETAHRFIKMCVNEIFAGKYQPPPKITNFPNDGYQSLYTTSGITIRSVCAHHLQNISGECWVGIFPEEKVIGLSKFNRIVHWIASRPQIQEEMTTQVANALVDYAETPNVAVVIKAKHGCMSMRGVKEPCGEMSTAVMLGKFQTDPSLKDEFYKLIGFSHSNALFS